ncbi:hypothetical protein OOU_Y34scaffold00126g38 [Pyricularia oryzae Y34]|uniref:Uncharacterized protein n=2 Tax=Pyricularia oryzae TaxID=318829 RepID=A0AA97P862_PYRO3|nr:hypothetical protein OOU_Y34scaffold00126g38 [Pyricularia oryzae Y34]
MERKSLPRMHKAGVQSRSGTWRTQAANGRHDQNWDLKGVARCGDSAFRRARVNVSASERLSTRKPTLLGAKNSRWRIIVLEIGGIQCAGLLCFGI